METLAVLNNRPLRIVLPGGSGLLGTLLARHFRERGHHVTVLTRSPYAAPWQTVHWDGEHLGSWTDCLDGADVCINLTGRSINCRHNAANRQAIYDSRIGSTRMLGEVIARLVEPPRVWMNASGATAYKRIADADGIDLPQDETTAELGGQEAAVTPISGKNNLSAQTEPTTARWVQRRDFTSRVVLDWEAALFQSPTPQTRKVALRTAGVFSPTPGSVFAVLSRLVRAGLGGTAGNGRQFVSWIHEADYARALEFLIDHEELEGPVNIAAPGPLPNREFMEKLRDAWEVPNGLPAPALAIKVGAFFLRSAPELVLKSSRAVPGRLLDQGFEFQFPEWFEAAEDLVRQWRRRHD
jgi:NAD dependent epimerase/dehydratase family enzyme